VLGHGRPQRIAVAHRGDDLVAPVAEQLHQAVAQDRGVLGDDDAHVSYPSAGRR
jgi:hypothetical protein